MKKVVLKISGVTNSMNAMKLERQLNKNPEIKSAAVKWKQKTATILYQDSLTIKEIEKQLQDLGYESLGIDLITSGERVSLFPIIVLGIGFLVLTYFLFASKYHWLFGSLLTEERKNMAWLLLGGLTFLSSLDIIWEGFKNLFLGKCNRYSLLTVGVGSAFIYSVWSMALFLRGNIETYPNYMKECILLLLLAKIGKYIDSKINHEIVNEIRQIAGSEYSKVNIKEEDTYREMNVKELRQEDKMVCLPGDRILVDGIVTGGYSHVDESLITGHSQPIVKSMNSKVLAGSLNCENELEYQKDLSLEESTTSEIIKLAAEEKNNQKKEYGKVDKVCRFYVPLILLIGIGLACLEYFTTQNISNAVNKMVLFLLVSSPSGFFIATPVAMRRSMKYLKKGFYMKRSEILEAIRKVNIVILDKTGTITHGYLSISRINNHSEMNEKELLELLGSIEKHSTHALARGITKYLRSEKIRTPHDFITEDLPGYGVKAKDDENIYYACNGELLEKLDIINSYAEEERKMKMEGNSVVYLTKNSKVIATFGLKDILRKESKKLIHSLKEKGFYLILLTGDDEITTTKIAKDLEFDQIYAGVGPKEKSNFIKQLQQDGKRVMFIGDGINDAPALATANIGVALKNTTDIPPSAANVILNGNNILKVLEMFSVSKSISRVLRRDILLSFLLTGVLLVISFGWIPKVYMTPTIFIGGIFLHIVIVFLTTLRLKKNKVKKD